MLRTPSRCCAVAAQTGGMMVYEAYMPAPIRNAARLVRTSSGVVSAAQVASRPVGPAGSVAERAGCQDRRHPWQGAGFSFPSGKPSSMP
jgi:predicted transcriptional regulator